MYRVEIISNVSLEFDLKESFLKIEKEFSFPIFYTKVNYIQGKGKRGEKQGDSIWPEENFIVIIYTDNFKLVDRLKKAVEEIKGIYSLEGIKIFILKGNGF